MIMLTGFGSIEHAVEAIRAGAIDYITKPIRAQQLELAVSRALDYVRLKRERAQLLREVMGMRTEDEEDQDQRAERDVDPGGDPRAGDEPATGEPAAGGVDLAGRAVGDDERGDRREQRQHDPGRDRADEGDDRLGLGLLRAVPRLRGAVAVRRRLAVLRW